MKSLGPQLSKLSKGPIRPAGNPAGLRSAGQAGLPAGLRPARPSAGRKDFESLVVLDITPKSCRDFGKEIGEAWIW